MSLVELFGLQEEMKISSLYDKSKFQDSYSFRVQRRALIIAEELIDLEGRFDFEKLSELDTLLEKEAFLFNPSGFSDFQSILHMKSVLKRFERNSPFFQIFQKFQAPLCHEWANEIVLSSVGHFHGGVPSTAQIKRAVLSACLTSLRQNVGSCFATAPSILIQQEQTERLLLDLYELLMTGKMKKVIRGIEISIPLSPTTGGGDLYRKVTLTQDLCASPGLQKAFEVISINMDLEKILTPLFLEKETRSIIEIIHDALLLHLGIKEEDLSHFKESERSFLKSKEFLKGVKIGSSSSKAMKCEEFFSLEKKAQTAFKAGVAHPLLKAWEFTLASFSESKMEFSNWNLYSSLGMHPSEKGGIGEVIYASLQGLLDVDEKNMREYDVEYQIAYDQVRATELLLKNAGSESEARRLQVELSSRFYHMRSCLEMRDTLHANLSEYSTFLSSLVTEYSHKFSEYFQEIFDADLHGIVSDEYEDSPAGFRLVYKHGRSNAFLWSMIRSEEEYREALIDFFLLVEPQIAASFSWEPAAKILTEITNSIVLHLRTSAFLDSALERSLKVHKERGETGKPWAYLSGGSMSLLLQTYYKREEKITEESKKVESPSDLLVFLLDTVKNLPLLEENKKLLMSSPSHAFTLIPFLEPFQSGVKEDLFTYTWVRDAVILPRKKFYHSITLAPFEQSFLLEELASKHLKPVAHLLHRVPQFQESTIRDFRNSILESIPAFLEDVVDSFFYEMMPLVSGYNWKELIRKLLEDLNPSALDKVLDSKPDFLCEVLSSKKLQELAKALYLESEGNLSFPFDLHEAVTKKAESLGLAPPPPVLVADTNWSQFYFAFIVNPGTDELELWRVESISGEGYPMSSWKKWFTLEGEAFWNIYTRPFEYT